nr:uncharacterized protein LOC108175626 isoform X2 [Oryctolagus cuniculus]
MAARGHTARREGQGSGAERRSGRRPRAEASGRRGEEPEMPGGRSGADRKRRSPAEPAHPGPSRRACVSGRAHSHRVSIEGARPHRRLRGSGEQGPVLRGCPAGRHQPSALYRVAGGCSGPAVGKAAGSFLESLFWDVWKYTSRGGCVTLSSALTLRARFSGEDAGGPLSGCGQLRLGALQRTQQERSNRGFSESPSDET